MPESPHFAESFQREIRERFGLDEAFVRRLIRNKPTSNPVISKWEDLVNPTQQLSSAYIHFALSTVVRGRQARDLIIRKTGLDSGRSLDVGSAYGGMVIAFAEAGFDATGVEIDQHWCDLGNLNCSSRGFGNRIRQADFLAEPFAESYAIITCNDVIEHVIEPRRALEKMASMLAPGGTLYLVVPNARSYDHVVRDGHYGQFGINLLEHHAARAYYDAKCWRVYNKDYSCGEFYPLPWYRTQLAGNGLDVAVHRTTSSTLPDRNGIERVLQQLDSAYAAWDRQGLPEILSDQIVDRFLGYRSDLLKDYASVEQSEPSVRVGFLEAYMDSFWTILARKPGHTEDPTDRPPGS